MNKRGIILTPADFTGVDYLKLMKETELNTLGTQPDTSWYYGSESNSSYNINTAAKLLGFNLLLSHRNATAGKARSAWTFS